MKNVLVSPNFKDMLKPNIEIGSFPDGDSHLRVNNIKNYRDQKVILLHRLYPNQNTSLMELIIILNMLKKINAKVTLIAPYLPYARQDKIFLEGEAPSAEIICNLIHKSGCQKLITFDCHFLKKEGKFIYGDLPIENISLGKELTNYTKKICPGNKLEIIAPDEGAAYLVQKTGGKTMKKTRKSYIGNKISYRYIENIRCDFNVKGKNVLILDDMISTGSTMIKAIENLRIGEARKIYCAATHGFFLKNSLKKLKSLSDGVFVSDTILSPVSKISIRKKLKNIVS